MHRLALILLLWLALPLAPAQAQKPAPGCKAPAPVCAVSARVVAISSYVPVGSAVILEPGLLVTNRHVVADNGKVDILAGDGGKRVATVIPTSYPGDLVLLKAEGLNLEGALALAPAEPDQQVYVIGADVGRGAVRAYLPGKVIAVPAEGRPLARVHHSARSQPGNSGGALVNRDGALVAIVTSGGEGRNEAIPAAEIARLKDMSGAAYAAESGRMGMAYRKCSEALNAARSTSQRLHDAAVTFLLDQCRATGNRQLYDDAGRALAQQRFLDPALDLFRQSLDQDPNGLNTRLSMAITLHVAQRYAEEVPHLKMLMQALPMDPQVLRLAIQAGKWGGDEALAQNAFNLLVEHHPQLRPVAEKFMKQPPPGPAAPVIK